MATKIGNFTASFMKWNKTKLTDVFGNTVGTVEYSSAHMPYKYKKPSIIYDFTFQGQEGKTPVIRELAHVKDIEALGFYLCSVPAPREWKWTKSKRAVNLIKKGSMDERYARRLADINGDVKCLYDEANMRIKLTGGRTGPLGETQWFEVTNA